MGFYTHFGTRIKFSQANVGFTALTLQSETVDVCELGGNILAIALGGLEAGLLNSFQRFFVEAGATAFGDFTLLLDRASCGSA